MDFYVDFGDPINDYCEATSISFGAQVSRSGGGASHTAQPHDMSFSKELDDLSHDLWVNMISGTVFPRVTVEVWNTDSCIVIYSLRNVMMASLHKSGGGAVSSEYISLNFESMSVRYFS